MKVRFFAGLLFIIFLLSGCGKASVKDDIVNYVNKELPEVAAIESKAISAYDRISGVNFKNDAVMYSELVDTVIPGYEEFLRGLKKINPRTKELQSIHDIYIESAENQLEGFSMIVSALDKQDPDIITEGNKYLDKGREGINDFIKKLRKLAQENDLEIN